MMEAFWQNKLEAMLQARLKGGADPQNFQSRDDAGREKIRRAHARHEAQHDT
jgi:hypothetical protein